MPPPLDFTNRRFGALLVLERAGQVRYGRTVQGWLCRCDCGVEEVVPQPRLPYADYIARHSRRVVTACSQCRLRRTCAVCGNPFVAKGGGASRRATCSDACAEEYRKDKGRRAYHRRAEKNPGLAKQAHARRKQRMLTDPEYAALVAAWERRREEARQERRRADPAYAEAERARARAGYARHKDEIQAKRREALDRMTPAQREDWICRMRAYGRAYRARFRAELKANPERHREFLDTMREWKRQRALARLLSVGDDLLRRS